MANTPKNRFREFSIVQLTALQYGLETYASLYDLDQIARCVIDEMLDSIQTQLEKLGAL
jgi:hypothetical protein